MLKPSVLAYSLHIIECFWECGLLLQIRSLLIPPVSLLAFLASTAWADVYKCSTDNGSVTLSNVEKGANCKKMVLPPPEAKRPSNAKADPVKPAVVETKPAEKPKSTYENAAMERKRIIQEEIDLEKTRLSAVQARIKDLAAQANKTPEQLKDIVALQQKENLHISNLQLLQKELNK